MRQITALLALLPFVMPAALRADIIMLKDDNVLEVKVIGPVMHAPNPKEKEVQCLEAEDEKGKKHYFPLSEIKERWAQKTSWEEKAENEEWYKRTSAKIEKNWTAQAKYGQECRKKNLAAEALVHFKAAYELRQMEPALDKDNEEQRHAKLARWLETDCGMLDEAVLEYAKVYEEKVKTVPTTAQGYVNLAAYCVEHDLEKQAETEYKKGLAKFPTDNNLKKAYDLFKRSQIIPLNHEMFRSLEGRMAVACKYIRGLQNPDGSFGNDAEEAGVQALRGMTGLSAEALLAEWDLKYFQDPEKHAACPKEITRALDFLLTGKMGSAQTSRGFQGDDLWGPAFSLEFLLRCYTRPYLADRKYDIELRVPKEIELLKRLQRRDGGWNYYNFIPYSASFLTAMVTINLVSARNLGFAVDPAMIKGGRFFLESTKYGEGTYRYSPGTGESGVNTSFSPLGASARSPLCELGCIAAGGGTERSLRQAVGNFNKFEGDLAKLRGKSGTHIGKGKTAPYYFMFSHYWTARAEQQLPRSEYINHARTMFGFICLWQEPNGTFHDFTGVKNYRLYATALGVMAMHQLVSAEEDPAFKKIEVAQPVVIDPPPKLVLKLSK